MTAVHALLLDLRPDHRRWVRNALLPLGWNLDDGALDRVGHPPAPDGALEIRIAEAPRSDAPVLRTPGPTLWILRPGDAVPAMIGEGPHEFLTLPTTPEEVAARARALARAAHQERSLRRTEAETAGQIARLKRLAASMETHLAPSVDDVLARLSALEGEGARAGESRGGLKELRNSVNLLARRIEEAIDAARAELGLSIETSLRRVDLRPVLQEVQEWAIPRVKGHEQEILIHLAPDCPPVCGDPERLGQALRHLVEDALRRAPRGARIELGAEPDPETAGQVRLSVFADGPVPPWSGTSETGAGEDGADDRRGVGLTLVDAIAAGSGGRFEIDGAGECGHCAQIQIPVWGTRAAQIAEAQALLASRRVEGAWWVCRSTGATAVAGERQCAASILLSPGEILKIVDDPIPGWDRLGRVREFRERGSLGKALQPSVRIQTIEARKPPAESPEARAA